MVRDWPNRDYGFNEALISPPVKYGDMEEFSRLLPPGAFMGGVAFQDCFLHWLVSPACRRYRVLKHRVSGWLRVYLFLPCWLRPPPGGSDCCVKLTRRVSRLEARTLKIIVRVDDARVVDVMGTHGDLAVDVMSFKRLLGSLGIRYLARKGKHWWPPRVILWLGFMVGANEGLVRIEDKKATEGMSLRQGIFGLQPDASLSARGLLPSVSFLDFVRWVAPVGFRRLRHGWNVGNDSGTMETRRSGDGCVDVQVAIAEELRSDML